MFEKDRTSHAAWLSVIKTDKGNTLFSQITDPTIGLYDTVAG